VSFAQGTPVTFSGIANDAEDGSLSSTIHWTSNVDGSLGDGASIQATNLTVGSHTISASVVDSSGAPATASIAITPAPPPFQVVFNATPTAGLAPVLVSFNACASTGTNLRFRWDFDNDGVDDQVNPCSAQHTYTAPGVYTAKLTVEESVPGGDQITMTKQILASSPPDPGDPGDCGGRRWRAAADRRRSAAGPR
jgi:PKD repeat protein